MLLSIIVPCFNEEAAIPYFYEEMNRVLDGMHEKWTDFYSWTMAHGIKHWRS